MTVAEVAEFLKVNQQTVRNWIDNGELPAVRVGVRRVRIRRSEIEKMLGIEAPEATEGVADAESNSEERVAPNEQPQAASPVPVLNLINRVTDALVTGLSDEDRVELADRLRGFADRLAIETPPRPQSDASDDSPRA